MFTIYILLLIAVIVGGIIWGKIDDEWYLPSMMWTLAIPILAICICSLCELNTGEKVYTGYIYSVEDSFNKTVGHIRFSEYAGEDAQPSFCASKNSETAKRIKELAGSGKKVKVKVPSGFAINMWYGQCQIEAEIIEEEE